MSVVSEEGGQSLSGADDIAPAPERAEEFRRVDMHDTMCHDFILPKVELCSSGEGAVDEKICDLEKAAFLSKLLNRVASVHQV